MMSRELCDPVIGVRSAALPDILIGDFPDYVTCMLMIQNLTLVKSQGKLLPDQNVNLDGDLVIPVYLFCFTLLSSVL